mmetsp:Transcript_44315/g.128223  ORF Transcript_44315/g.128223 Transcript_44315/m.128223 type:complete len:267 (-) Transcript_44315:35-835(-)
MRRPFRDRLPHSAAERHEQRGPGSIGELPAAVRQGVGPATCIRPATEPAGGLHGRGDLRLARLPAVVRHRACLPLLARLHGYAVCLAEHCRAGDAHHLRLSEPERADGLQCAILRASCPALSALPTVGAGGVLLRLAQRLRHGRHPLAQPLPPGGPAAPPALRAPGGRGRPPGIHPDLRRLGAAEPGVDLHCDLPKPVATTAARALPQPCTAPRRPIPHRWCLTEACPQGPGCKVRLRRLLLQHVQRHRAVDDGILAGGLKVLARS